jgi:hypothetical protein
MFLRADPLFVFNRHEAGETLFAGRGFDRARSLEHQCCGCNQAQEATGEIGSRQHQPIMEIHFAQGTRG